MGALRDLYSGGRSDRELQTRLAYGGLWALRIDHPDVPIDWLAAWVDWNQACQQVLALTEPGAPGRRAAVLRRLEALALDDLRALAAELEEPHALVRSVVEAQVVEAGLTDAVVWVVEGGRGLRPRAPIWEDLGRSIAHALAGRTEASQRLRTSARALEEATARAAVERAEAVEAQGWWGRLTLSAAAREREVAEAEEAMGEVLRLGNQVARLEDAVRRMGADLPFVDEPLTGVAGTPGLAWRSQAWWKAATANWPDHGFDLSRFGAALGDQLWRQSTTATRRWLVAWCVARRQVLSTHDGRVLEAWLHGGPDPVPS